MGEHQGTHVLTRTFGLGCEELPHIPILGVTIRCVFFHPQGHFTHGNLEILILLLKNAPEQEYTKKNGYKGSGPGCEAVCWLYVSLSPSALMGFVHKFSHLLLPLLLPCFVR